MAICPAGRNPGTSADDDGRDAGVDGSDDDEGVRPPTADEREANDAMRAFEARSLTFRTLGRGRGPITIDLPLDQFAEVAKVLECMEDQLREQEREPEESTDPDSPVGPRSASVSRR